MAHGNACAMRAAIGSTALGLIATIFAGCHTNPASVRDDVQFLDDDAPAYNGSVVVRPEDMRLRGKAGRGGIEFGYERYRGESEQEVETNHFVQLGSTSFSGPQTVLHTVDVQHGHIAYNHLFNFGSHFELEPALGVSYDKMIATSRRESVSLPLAKDDQHSWGLMVRVTPRFMINRFIGLQAQVRTGPDGDGEWTGNFSGAAILRPVPNVELKAGYYQHNQEFDLRSGTSDVEAEFEGFLAHVTFIF
jgi:hypothetical protein